MPVFIQISFIPFNFPVLTLVKKSHLTVIVIITRLTISTIEQYSRI